MDGLSGGASIIAVVSLAVQLADNTKKLYGFWQSVGEAPASIRTIATELKVLSTVLADIAAHDQKYGPDEITTSVLESCTDHVRTMLSMTTELEVGMSSAKARSRKWSAIKTVFREEKILKFREFLQETKSTLILARQTLSERHSAARVEDQNRMILSLSQRLSSIQLQQTQVQTSGVITISQDSGVDDQFEKLHSEVRRMASTISNPFMAAAFQRSMEIALRQTFESTNQNTMTPIFQTATPPREVRDDQQSRIFPAHTSSHEPSYANKNINMQLDKEVTPPNEQIRQHRPFRKRKLRSCSSTKTSNMFGSVIISSTTYFVYSANTDISTEIEEELDYQEESEFRFSMHPAQWLVRLGLRYGLRMALTRSSTEWKHTLQSFRPVPDDSLIFEFCKRGNIDGIRHLLSRKEASIWDTNSKGYTPLHIGARNGHLDVCRLLVAAGADLDIRTSGKINTDRMVWLDDSVEQSCLTIIAETAEDSSSGFYKSSQTLIDALRLFLTASVPNDEEDYCWEALFSFGVSEFKAQSSSNIAYLWLLQTLKLDLAALGLFSTDLLNWSIDDGNINAVELILEAYDGVIDAPYGLGSCLSGGAFAAAEIFVCRGANIHFEWFSTARDQIIFHTPTSVALCNSESFYLWRQVLVSQSIDLKEFVAHEALLRVMNDSGWTEHALLEVFQLLFAPFSMPRLKESHSKCPKCGKHVYVYNPWVEPAWQRLLNKIRTAHSHLQSHPKAPEGDPKKDSESHSMSEGAGVNPPPNNMTMDTKCGDGSNSGGLIFVPDGVFMCQSCWYDSNTPKASSIEIVESLFDLDGLLIGSIGDENSDADESDEESSPFLLRI